MQNFLLTQYPAIKTVQLFHFCMLLNEIPFTSEIYQTFALNSRLSLSNWLPALSSKGLLLIVLVLSLYMRCNSSRFVPTSVSSFWSTPTPYTHHCYPPTRLRSSFLPYAFVRWSSYTDVTSANSPSIATRRPAREKVRRNEALIASETWIPGRLQGGAR